MNRRGFLFGLGATIAVVPAASLMPVRSLIVDSPYRWKRVALGYSVHDMTLALDLAGPGLEQIVTAQLRKIGDAFIIEQLRHATRDHAE